MAKTFHRLRSVIYGPADKLNALIVMEQLTNGNKLFDEYATGLRRYLIGLDDPFSDENDLTAILDLNLYSQKWGNGHAASERWCEMLVSGYNNFDLSWETMIVWDLVGHFVERSPEAKKLLWIPAPTIANNIPEIPDTDITVKAL